MGWILIFILLLPFCATEFFVTLLMGFFAVGFIVSLITASWGAMFGFLFVYLIVAMVSDAMKKGRIL